MERRTKQVMAALCVAALTIGTDFTGALMLVTSIELDFAVDITMTQWVLNIYALTFAMGLVAGGRLGDMFGRRRLLLIGLAVFAVASLGCAAAPSVGWLIAARALQGIGSAAIWPSILAIASTVVREEERGFAMGLVIGGVTLGNVIGPILAGLVDGLGDWRLFFAANLVLAALTALLLLRWLPAEARAASEERVDIAGILVLSLALLALLYGLDVGADWGWGSWPLLGLFAASLLLFAVFPLLEARVAAPLVPPPMLRNGQFLMALSANGLLIPAVFLLFLYLPQYLHKVLGWPILTATLGILPLMVCLSVLSVLSGRLYNRIGPRWLLILGYGLVVLGCLAVFPIGPGSGYLGLLPVMLLVGFGAGPAVGAASTVAVSAADPARAGLAGALSFMAHLALGAIGVSGGTALLSAISRSHLAEGLAAKGIDLSAADMLTLNAGAPSAAATQEILGRFGPEASQEIARLVQEAFTAGLHAAFGLAFAFAAIGLVVTLRLDHTKLSNVDHES